MRLTKNPRVNLSRTARWLHANLDHLDDTRRRPLTISLTAWELEDDQGREGSGELYVRVRR